MPDTKELLETVRDYEIRIYNESRTLHLHYPISGTLRRHRRPPPRRKTKAR